MTAHNAGRIPRGLFFRVLPVLLAVLLCLSACTERGTGDNAVSGASSGTTDTQAPSRPPQKIELPERDSTPVRLDYTAVSYTVPEWEPLAQKADKLLRLLEWGGTARQVLLAYDSLRADYDSLTTQAALAQVASNRDVSDKKAEEDYGILSDLLSRFGNRLIEVTEAILDSDLAESARLTWGGEYAAHFEQSRRMNSPAVEELQRREQELCAEFSRLSASDTVSAEGKEGTRQELGAVEYARLRSEELGGIYVDLIEVRREIAAALGFDSYPEYSYMEFSRDYTPAQASAFAAEVKAEIAPLYQRLASEFSTSSLYLHLLNPESALPLLREAAAEFSGGMEESLAFLTECHAYDFESSGTKLNLTYTIYLPDYNCPYILMSPGNQYYDVSTVFHEFGHFNNFYHYPEGGFNAPFNYDLAEIHSQALELLMFPWYEDLFGTDAELARKAKLRDMLYTLLSGCMEDEFQQAAFAMEEPTPEKLSELYGTLQKEYFGKTARTAPYEWVTITHTFTMPFYYISYATSLVGALEIWGLARDGEDAPAIYTRLCSYGTQADYQEVLSKCGLNNPFQAGTAASVAETVSGYFEQPERAAA